MHKQLLSTLAHWKCCLFCPQVSPYYVLPVLSPLSVFRTKELTSWPVCVGVVMLPGFHRHCGIRRCPPPRLQNDLGCPDSFLPAAALRKQCPGGLGPWGTGSTVPINAMHLNHTFFHRRQVGGTKAGQERSKISLSLSVSYTNTNIGQTFIGQASLTIHILVCIIF